MVTESSKQHTSITIRWLFALSVILCGLLIGCSKEDSSSTAHSGAVCTAPLPASEQTALDRYVSALDTNYNFHLVRTIPGKDQTTFLLEMTSQAWLTTNEVDRTLWKHWLLVVRPDKISSSKSLLYISGGANDGKEPKSADASLAQIAVTTKSIVTELKMVPNQPLVFAGETEERSEDALIAYTWDKFLRTGDEKWPVRLPMTKAAVRAMDTVISFCCSPEGGHQTVDGFVVAGGSKRGWTTWTTAAVDMRVIGIVPIVIDLLNIEPSMLHHYAAYGFWAPSVGDYTALRIMDWTGTPQYHALMRIEEPYQYKKRFTMPKLLINASGDQFFLPDSSQFYFDDLPGVKYLRYVPNADHSLKGSDARESLMAFYNAILYQQPLPQLSWKLPTDGSIRVETRDKPTEIKLWQATNPDARDFRIETFGPKWESTSLTDQGGGVYLAKVPPPAKGWSAFFVELTFPSTCPAPFKFTTPVRVLPDTLPARFVSAGPPK
jgi:PhoPQ-activated pathogenicity-related protein